MEPFVASLIFYSYVFGVCEVLRRLIKKANLPPDSEVYLVEIVGTIQVCAPIFDVGFVATHYGLLGVFVEIFGLEFLNVLTVGDAVVNPIALVWQFRAGSLSLAEVVVRFLAECLGGFLSFPLTMLFWRFAIHEDYEEKYHDGREHCEADLSVSILVGTLMELAATVVSRFVEHRSGRFGEKMEPTINCLTSAFLTILGLYQTGMYMNPIVASACTWGCGDQTRLGHLSVYWLGPLIAWIISDFINSPHEHHAEKGKVE